MVINVHLNNFFEVQKFLAKHNLSFPVLRYLMDTKKSSCTKKFKKGDSDSETANIT